LPGRMCSEEGTGEQYHCECVLEIGVVFWYESCNNNMVSQIVCLCEVAIAKSNTPALLGVVPTKTYLCSTIALFTRGGVLIN